MHHCNRKTNPIKRNLKTSKAFIYYLQAIGDLYENLEDYNSKQKKKC